MHRAWEFRYLGEHVSGEDACRRDPQSINWQIQLREGDHGMVVMLAMLSVRVLFKIQETCGTFKKKDMHKSAAGTCVFHYADAFTRGNVHWVVATSIFIQRYKLTWTCPVSRRVTGKSRPLIWKLTNIVAQPQIGKMIFESFWRVLPFVEFGLIHSVSTNLLGSLASPARVSLPKN